MIFNEFLSRALSSCLIEVNAVFRMMNLVTWSLGADCALGMIFLIRYLTEHITEVCNLFHDRNWIYICNVMSIYFC